MLVFGILLVLEGAWTFGMLWVVLGLAGFAATFVTGFFVLRPQDPAAQRRPAAQCFILSRVLRHMRIDYAVIAMVIAAMVLKPTRDDVWTLVAMAAVIAVVAALTLRRTAGGAAAEAGESL